MGSAFSAFVSNYVFKTGFGNRCIFDGLGPVLVSAFSVFVFSYVFKTVLEKACFFYGMGAVSGAAVEHSYSITRVKWRSKICAF